MKLLKGRLNMAKFKIGDRVRAVNEYDDNENIVGKIGTVISVYDYDTDFIGVEFDDEIYFGGHSCGGKGKEGHCWWCPDRILEPVRYNEKIVITTDGKTTTAKIYAGKSIIKTATAKCSPDDKFDFVTGAKIAFERLTGKYAEKSFDWNAFKREKTIVKVTKNNWREFVSEAKNHGLTFCDGVVENPFEMFFDKFMRRTIPHSFIEVKPDEIFILYEGKNLKYSHISEGRTVIKW